MTLLALAAVWAAAAQNPFYPPEEKRPKCLQRGAVIRVGRYDADGNFVPRANVPPIERDAAGTMERTVDSPVFGAELVIASFPGLDLIRHGGEYRSGCIVVGVDINNPHPRLVPTIGERVRVEGRDFRMADRTLFVYNKSSLTSLRPDDFEKGNKPPRGDDRTTRPPNGGVPAGWVLEPYYVAASGKPPAGPWFVRVIGDVMEFGRLNCDGEFFPERDLPVVPRSVETKFPGVKYAEPRMLDYYTLPRDGKKSEPAYEFRSRRLIRGTLHDTGNFAPEPGSTVIDFKDFDPVNDKRRIYNLPGVLVRAPAADPKK